MAERRALILQPDPNCPPGLLEPALAAHGLRLEVEPIVGATQTDAPNVSWAAPDVHGFDLIVVLGARWSVNDHALLGAWLEDLRKTILAAHQSQISILGICFGAQTLAHALGGNVRPAARPKVGWSMIETDRPELIPPGPWFQWHSDQLSPPPGATELARTEACSQAYRIGSSLGVQFHPEVTVEIVQQWLADDRHNEASSDASTLREATIVQTVGARKRLEALLRAILQRLDT